MEHFFASVLFFVFLYAGISGIWMLSERILYGKIKVSKLHDVIAIILSISLYLNISYFFF